MRVRLVHWSSVEARRRIETLESAGYVVDFGPLEKPADLRRIKDTAPAAIVIDLSRLPSQGRDLALWLRRQRATRHVPLVFAGGDAKKVARFQQSLPDAAYTDWNGLPWALEAAIESPPKNPVVPASTLADYSGTPLPRKLGIKPGFVVALIEAPGDFEETLGNLPEGVTLRPSGRGRRDLTICFVRSRRQLERRIGQLVRAAAQGSAWIAWPKKASSMATDLSQADVRGAGLASGLVDYKVCAIDETWSGLCFALRKRRGRP